MNTVFDMRSMVIKDYIENFDYDTVGQPLPWIKKRSMFIVMMDCHWYVAQHLNATVEQWSRIARNPNIDELEV